MPERDGFEVVKAIPPADLPAILFVTAHDRYALRAFDVHAVDYLLKPFTGERFRTALARARERIARRADGRRPARRLAGDAAEPARLSHAPAGADRRPDRVRGSGRGGLDGGGRQLRPPAREAARVPGARDAGVARGAARSRTASSRDSPLGDRADRSDRRDPADSRTATRSRAAGWHDAHRQPHLARRAAAGQRPSRRPKLDGAGRSHGEARDRSFRDLQSAIRQAATT